MEDIYKEQTSFWSIYFFIFYESEADDKALFEKACSCDVETANGRPDPCKSLFPSSEQESGAKLYSWIAPVLFSSFTFTANVRLAVCEGL